MGEHLELHKCQGGDFLTDDRFWDCECRRNFIHAKAVTFKCYKCGAWVTDSPDARADEIMAGLDFATKADREKAIEKGYFADITLEQGMKAMQDAGMRVLVAEKAEDIDNWPTLDELFPDLVKGEDDEGE